MNMNMNMNNNHANKNGNEERSIGNKRNIVDCDDDFSYDDDDADEDNDHNDIVQNSNKKKKSSSHSSKEELEIKYDAVLAVVGKFPNGTTKDTDTGSTTTTTRPNLTDAAESEHTLFQIAERKKKDKAQEYKIKNDFAKTMTMNDITWGKDSQGDTIILDIGGCAEANWNVQMLTTFCRRVGLTVRENSKRRSDCIRHILELHEPGMVRHAPLKNDTNRSRPKITAAAKTTRTVPHCVTTSILEKNQEAKAVFIVQQETEEVQKKKAKHEYQESLDKSFEALEQRIFETKMELRIITRKLLQTSNAVEVEDVTVHQEYLEKKLDRNEKNMKTLKIKIHNTQYI